MAQPEDRRLSEDDSTPVPVQPGEDHATPTDWNWRLMGTSQPNAATFHINHSDVTRVKVDALRPSDSPPDAPFVVSEEIPILIIDSLDQFWAGESHTKLPLQGLRVPVAGDTEAEAKQKLAGDLAAQLRLLLLLASSRQGKIAPELQANLVYLTTVLTERGKAGGP
jgi:hypothetical protein